MSLEAFLLANDLLSLSTFLSGYAVQQLGLRRSVSVAMLAKRLGMVS